MRDCPYSELRKACTVPLISEFNRKAMAILVGSSAAEMSLDLDDIRAIAVSALR
jgi:hypothetical protein